MNRRTVLKGIGTSSVAAVAPVGGVAAAATTAPTGGTDAETHDECVGWREDPDCRFDQLCEEISCPSKCCDCLCLE